MPLDGEGQGGCQFLRDRAVFVVVIVAGSIAVAVGKHGGNQCLLHQFPSIRNTIGIVGVGERQQREEQCGMDRRRSLQQGRFLLLVLGIVSFGFVIVLRRAMIRLGCTCRCAVVVVGSGVGIVVAESITSSSGPSPS